MFHLHQHFNTWFLQQLSAFVVTSHLRLFEIYSNLAPLDGAVGYMTQNPQRRSEKEPGCVVHIPAMSLCPALFVKS